jgi:probable phosphoglycerate mutase
MIDIPKFNLYLIRHAQSEVNARENEIGQPSDTPLTPLGLEQGRLLGERLKKEIGSFDVMYHSGYLRARTTAEIVKEITGYKPNLIHDHDLREYSAGDWTGKKRKETLTPEVRLSMGYLNHGFTPPNGESLDQVERRASQWLDYLMHNKETLKVSQEHQKNNTQYNIGVFSHGMTIKCLLHYVMGFDKGFTWKVQIDNTSITKLSFGEVGWRLYSINDCGHLTGLDEHTR